MVQDSPSRKQDQFIVRLPDGMRDRIKAAAEANNRSMNAEIVATLEEKYPAPLIKPVDLETLMLALRVAEFPESPEADEAIARIAAIIARETEDALKVVIDPDLPTKRPGFRRLAIIPTPTDAPEE